MGMVELQDEPPFSSERKELKILINILIPGRGYSFVVDHLHAMLEGQDLIPHTRKKKRRKVNNYQKNVSGQSWNNVGTVHS